MSWPVECGLLFLLTWTFADSTDFQVILETPSHRNQVPSTDLHASSAHWSECSRSCGNGVSTRNRMCATRSDDLVQSSRCSGGSIERKVCHTQDCPTDTKGFLELQCYLHNGLEVAGHVVQQWVPDYRGSNPCHLQCRAVRLGFVYSFGKVIDGTSCSHENGSICVDGRCLTVGCDGYIESQKVLDMCGECDGDNSTCNHHEGIFNGQRPDTPVLLPSVLSTLHTFHGFGRGYSKITIIPKGARNIQIEDNSGNYLALMDDKSSFINGHWMLDLPGYYRVAGTKLHYSRTPEKETISAPGPTDRHLTLLVLLIERNPGIHYQYWLSKEETSTIQPRISPVDVSIHATSVSTRASPSTAIAPVTTGLITPVRQSNRSFPSFYRTTFPTFEQTTLQPRSPQETYKQYVTSAPKTSSNINNRSIGHTRETLQKSNVGISHSTNKPESGKVHSSRNMAEFQQNRNNIRNSDHLHTTLKPQQPSRDHEKLKKQKGQNYPSVFTSRRRTSKPYSVVSRLPKFNSSLPHSTSRFSSNKNFQTMNKILKNQNKHPHNKKFHYAGPLARGRKFLSGSIKSRKKYWKGSCPSCKKVKNQRKHFCMSDLVLRVVVFDSQIVKGQNRYDVRIIQSYKNTIAVLPREYLWSLDSCRCPRLRVGREYIVMARSGPGFRRNETRFLLDKSSFVRRYKQQRALRILKLKKLQNKKCKKFS
ncbi:ADAMTS-like protein 5 [Limulus polyphemus]|uniref:ADAMTS-like protein 5 n=1 Tax=Limulus polyphemus TaxID=6850 RepID=A0ABM1S411_LIMPO|nr:ADAMTS-like protein 5 [Limulus polyphemus]XP_022238366.1 ADAMTS-like protein 5 [Limulus polyphemus]